MFVDCILAIDAFADSSRFGVIRIRLIASNQCSSCFLEIVLFVNKFGNSGVVGCWSVPFIYPLLRLLFSVVGCGGKTGVEEARCSRSDTWIGESEGQGSHATTWIGGRIREYRTSSFGELPRLMPSGRNRGTSPQ